MGHSIDYTEFPLGTTVNEVLDAFSNCYDPHECSGYHGDFMFIDRTFNSREEAEHFLRDNYEGHYEDRAVKFYVTEQKPDTKYIAGLIEAYYKLGERRNKMYNDHYPTRVKAQYITCKKCGSKLNTEVMREEHYDRCPVCSADLWNPEYEKKIRELDKKIKEQNDAIESARLLNRKKTGEIRWLAKSEYHC